jgi:hypothetical protein
MNFFEVAAGIGDGIMGNGDWAYRWDMISLFGLFGLFNFLLRALTTRMSKRFIQMDNLKHEIARWLFGAVTGYVVMAFCLTALHTGPFPREMTSLGFTPERKNLFDVVAPDRQWLGFTQFASEKVFGSDRQFDGPYSDFIEGPGAANKIWPSFPIRYASRREELSGAFFGTDRPTNTGQQQQQQQQQPVRRQTGGGGAGF